MNIQFMRVACLSGNYGAKVSKSMVRRFSVKLIEEGCIYIHYPYCRQRCSYCNFVKFVPNPGKFWTFSDELIQDGMIRELTNCLKNSSIRSINSVFFGGGTPSLSNPSLVKDIVNVINRYCSFSTSAEVTLEANPTQLETKKLEAFKLAGINRLSIGVQSLQPTNLTILNRDHSYLEAVQCISEAKRIFPGKVSVDMMFALPFQTCESWKEDLEYMLQLCDDHLSLYQLTLEKGTNLYKNVNSGLYSVPDEEVKAEMYELAISLMLQYGFHRYEISNFAKNVKAECIHNKAVWQGTQYIGIGPGAHSRVYNKINFNKKYSETINCNNLIREARRNAADPHSWLFDINSKGTSVRLCESQSTLDVVMEYLATSLRTIEGLSHERWFAICNRQLTDFICVKDINPEFLYFDKGDLKATPKGLNVLDSILPTLINILDDKKTLIFDTQL